MGVAGGGEGGVSWVVRGGREEREQGPDCHSIRINNNNWVMKKIVRRKLFSGQTENAKKSGKKKKRKNEKIKQNIKIFISNTNLSLKLS